MKTVASLLKQKCFLIKLTRITISFPDFQLRSRHLPDIVQTFSVIADFQLERLDNLVRDVGGVVIVVVVEVDVVSIGVIGEV